MAQEVDVTVNDILLYTCITIFVYYTVYYIIYILHVYIIYIWDLVSGRVQTCSIEPMWWTSVTCPYMLYVRFTRAVLVRTPSAWPEWKRWCQATSVRKRTQLT